MKRFAFLMVINASAFRVVFLTVPVSCRCFLLPAHAASGSGLGPGEAEDLLTAADGALRPRQCQPSFLLNQLTGNQRVASDLELAQNFHLEKGFTSGSVANGTLFLGETFQRTLHCSSFHLPRGGNWTLLYNCEKMQIT